MKKIDLHIHTVSTISDRDFEFSLDTLLSYVTECHIDAIAITNHNDFDLAQFREIKQRLPCVVFPGVEVDIERGHLLTISPGNDLDAFADACSKLKAQISSKNDFVSLDTFKNLFAPLDDYLLIPHYAKNPRVPQVTIDALGKYITAGEASCAKKFVHLWKDNDGLPPVLFSDLRMEPGLSKFPPRQTYVNCGDISLPSLKLCLSDRTKLALTPSDGCSLFPVLANEQLISTGLNVLLGHRSSGKTHTLNEIDAYCENAKYIRQFSLVQQDSEQYAKQFEKRLRQQESDFVDTHLADFKKVFDDVKHVNLEANEKRLEAYVDTLKKAAEAADREDSFSKTKLFSETAFAISDTSVLSDLIQSVRQLIENLEYRPIIERHIEVSKLKTLARDLIQTLWDDTLENSKRQLANGIIRDVKDSLQLRTSAIQVQDIDLFEYAFDQKRVDRFEEIVRTLKTETLVYENKIQGFLVRGIRKPYANATDVKTTNSMKRSFTQSFSCYGDPYEYLRSLITSDAIQASDQHQLFCKIEFEILNRDGVPISGGERSEFVLLQEIKDAQNYDMLLIDEPESSFDNVFLNSDVNSLLRDISKSTPVVIVTHNSTVGVSIAPDFVLYASKEVVEANTEYRLYAGYPTDTVLRSLDGATIPTHDVLMNSLEAGYTAYEKRRISYEAVKDR